MKHDTESYIITIRRRNGYCQSANIVQTSATVIAVPQATLTSSDSEEQTSMSASKTNTIKAPLPGVIIAVNVNVGDVVRVGQELATLEAMKMENSIEATMDGTVTAIHAKEGDSVLEGTAIVTIGMCS